jgi:hypothetical protein
VRALEYDFINARWVGVDKELMKNSLVGGDKYVQAYITEAIYIALQHEAIDARRSLKDLVADLIVEGLAARSKRKPKRARA